MSSTDRIEKRIVLRASQSRVWRAISDARAFGAWFGMEIAEPFAAGTKTTGKIRPTKVDPEIAKLQEPHSGKSFELAIDRIEPERLFSFRWHPFAVDPNIDYANEPTTLVTFELTAAPEGTLLVITESGFDALPPARRAEALKANEGGWEAQTKLVEKYLTTYAG